MQDNIWDIEFAVLKTRNHIWYILVIWPMHHTALSLDNQWNDSDNIMSTHSFVIQNQLFTEQV